MEPTGGQEPTGGHDVGRGRASTIGVAPGLTSEAQAQIAVNRVECLVKQGGKVVAGLKRPFCRNRPLLVGFKGHTRSQNTRKHLPRLLRPRMSLKTH
jgi:hypothetical protein